MLDRFWSKVITESGAQAAAKTYEAKHRVKTVPYRCDKHLCWHLTTHPRHG